jgi:hypothetical protein
LSRNIPSGMDVTQNRIRPIFMAILTFKSTTQYVWSGAGNLVYGGNTYRGVGSFGKLGDISEGTDVKAYGTTIQLSGIDPTLLAESLTDIQIGAPATIYFALVDANCNILGAPYPLFVGTMDKPTVQQAPDTITITISLENKLSNLQRATQRRYTAADQNLQYPDDSAFDYVEILNDQALRWGS